MALYFCPTDGNCLHVEKDDHDNNKMLLRCITCPYTFTVYNVNKFRVEIPGNQKRDQMRKKYLEFKKIASSSSAAAAAGMSSDDVFGGAESFKNAPKTQATCEKCRNDSAYYLEIQIRSGDEAATIFYKCTNCSHTWKEG